MPTVGVEGLGEGTGGGGGVSPALNQSSHGGKSHCVGVRVCGVGVGLGDGGEADYRFGSVIFL